MGLMPTHAARFPAIAGVGTSPSALAAALATTTGAAGVAATSQKWLGGLTGEAALALTAFHAAAGRVTPELFGAAGDGTTDDTTAVQAAINTGRCHLNSGKTYKVTTGITRAGDLHLTGTGTLKGATAEMTVLTVSGSTSVATFDDVTIDGGDLAAIGVNFSAIARAVVRNCKVQNIYSATGARGFQFAAVVDFEARGCKFKKIRCLGDGTIGNASGTCMGLYATGTIEKGLVSGCRFEDVNNVDGSNNIIFEDADACHIQGVSNENQNVIVDGCYFTNCGKRAVKFNSSNTSASYRFSNSHVTSAWTGTADLVGSTNNGQYSVISCYGGSVAVDNVSMMGGVCGYFFEGSGSNLVEISLVNVKFNPEAHTYVNGNFTRFVNISGVGSATRFSAVNPSVCNLAASGISDGIRTTVLFGRVVNPDISCFQSAIEMVSGGTWQIIGGRLAYKATPAASSSSLGVYTHDGLVSLEITGTLCVGHLGQAVRFDTQTGTPMARCRVQGSGITTLFTYTGSPTPPAWLDLAGWKTTGAVTT